MKGFTLLELLIALTLMAFVSFFTAQSLKNTIYSGKRIQSEIDVLTELRAALNLIKSDIRRAYNDRDLYIAVYNEAQREHIRRWKEAKNKPKNPNPNANPSGQGTGGTGGGTTPPATNPQQQQQEDNSPPPEYKPREETVVTQFIGGKDEINFTSLNGNSVRKNSYASELVEIGYEIKKCKKRGKNQKDTECLWRRLSYYLDGNIEEGGQESVLIDDVTFFELKYLRKTNVDNEVEWRDDWSLDNANTQNRLPIAVEVTLEISKKINKTDKNPKKNRAVIYIPIDFENNRYIQDIIKMNSQGNPLTDQSTTTPTGSDFTEPIIDDNQGGF